MSESAATAASRAFTDFSRPTWSGTIISGKMTVSRRATSGRTRTSPGRAGLAGCLLVFVLGVAIGSSGGVRVVR